ncbi:DNA modification methylase [Rhizobiales bacterium GAS113]|nr:DNA modification methylase [Rhizobiales bacterium GAS113]
MSDHETYGKLLEGLHITGYTFERACYRIAKLLESGDWKECAGGFADIDAFLNSLGLEQFREITEQRRKIAGLIKKLQPKVSNRKIAAAIGVGKDTINRDLAQDAPQDGEKPKKNNSAMAQDTPPRSAEGEHWIDGERALSGTQAAKLVARRQDKAGKKAERERRRNLTPDLPEVSERYRLIHGDLADVEIERESIDCIVTDPPYRREHLDCFSVLAKRAAGWLRPGGSMLVMSGQSWLPEVLVRLGSHLTYQWTLAYLTPGGQAVQIFPRRVNSFWKPVFWFVKGEYAAAWVGDVSSSRTNDNDKRFHDWGQSESGMADLLDRVSVPGDMILDPFCGGGATGVVALRMNRHFIGIDIDEEAIATTARRLMKEAADADLVA